MKPIRIFRHVAHEGPGYLGDYLTQRAIPFELVAVDKGEAIPGLLDDVSALVFMGGPMSVNDDLPWIEAELALIRRAADKKMAVLGHCLGGQLISKALGGQVIKNEFKEIGWLAVEKLDNHASCDWLADVPQQFDAFHWHGETFTLPAGAVNVLKSDRCAHQAFVVDNIFAMQCHIEMTAALVSSWADCNVDEIRHTSLTVQSKATMMRDIDHKVVGLQRIADKIYDRWLQGV